MAIHKTDAVLLRRQEIRETSLILIAFTPDLGKIQGLIKGVRGARAAVPWVLEPLTHQAIVVYERRRSPLSLISSCDLIDAFDPIRRDLTRTAYASFCVDLVNSMTEMGDPHPEIFRLLLNSLRALAEGADPRSVARFVEVHLLKGSGLLPAGSSLGLSPEGRLSLEQMHQTPFEEVRCLHLVQAVEGELRMVFQRLFWSALGRELKSRTFLQALGVERPIQREAIVGHEVSAS